MPPEVVLDRLADDRRAVVHDVEVPLGVGVPAVVARAPSPCPRRGTRAGGRQACPSTRACRRESPHRSGARGRAARPAASGAAPRRARGRGRAAGARGAGHRSSSSPTRHQGSGTPRRAAPGSGAPAGQRADERRRPPSRRRSRHPSARARRPPRRRRAGHSRSYASSSGPLSSPIGSAEPGRELGSRSPRARPRRPGARGVSGGTGSARAVHELRAGRRRSRSRPGRGASRTARLDDRDRPDALAPLEQRVRVRADDQRDLAVELGREVAIALDADVREQDRRVRSLRPQGVGVLADERQLVGEFDAERVS